MKPEAHIVAANFIPEVEMPADDTWALRQLMTHRQLLVRHPTAARNDLGGFLNH